MPSVLHGGGEQLVTEAELTCVGVHEHLVHDDEADRFLPELGCVAADISLGRQLARTETAVVAYTLRAASDVSHQHERRVTTPLRAYLLHVRFHPLALPAGCWSYQREQIGAEPRHRRRTALDAFHTTHLLPTHCRPGVYGIEWEWPD